MDSEEFRAALGCFATGITIITAVLCIIALLASLRVENEAKDKHG